MNTCRYLWSLFDCCIARIGHVIHRFCYSFAFWHFTFIEKLFHHFNTVHVKARCQGVHDHPYYHVCPGILSLVSDPLPGNGCGSLNITYIQLFLFDYLLIYYLVQRKWVLYEVTSKSRFIQLTWSLAVSHITLVRDCCPRSTASVRYWLPAVISFKFLSVPPLLSITNGPRTYVTSLNLQRMVIHRP